MSNPYTPPTTQNAPAQSCHPDFRWMIAMTYAMCAVCMLGIPEKTNPPYSGAIGFGRGFIPGPALFGDPGFYIVLPLLALIPVAVLAAALRPFYRHRSLPDDLSGVNFVFLFCGLVVAIVNASLYRGG